MDPRPTALAPQSPDSRAAGNFPRPASFGEFAPAPVNPWEAANRATKAAQIALAITGQMTATEAEHAGPVTRALAAQLAGVKPASDATWAMCVALLRGNEARMEHYPDSACPCDRCRAAVRARDQRIARASEYADTERAQFEADRADAQEAESD